MNKHLDLRSILETSKIYTFYQFLVGGIKARRLFIQNDACIEPMHKVLDIGCGPGDIITFLPDVEYTGIDVDQAYINTAKIKYPKHNFFCINVDSFKIKDVNSFDTVISTGVLHHLDDEQVNALFILAKKALKPNSRLVTLDGCFTEKQSFVAKKLLEMDRGNYVRNETEYINLAKKHFKHVHSKINTDYFNIPYTLIIMECSN